jgi:hypothetical protein
MSWAKALCCSPNCLFFVRLFRNVYETKTTKEKEQQSRELQLVSAIIMDEASAPQWATSNEAPAPVQVHLRKIDCAIT